jgi:multidrug efflux pump subunit AcrB
VDPWGGYTREVRVELDPARLTALGLPINDILDAIRDANLDLPAGKLEEGRYEVTLRAPAEFTDLKQILDTAVARRDGRVVTLGQIARARDTYEKLTRVIRVDGERGLRVAIRKQADRLAARVGRGLVALENSYRNLLRMLLARRWTPLFVTLVLVAASLSLVPRIGTEFLPPTDEGEVRVTGEMEVGTRLELIDRQIRKMEAIVSAAVPEAVSSVVSVTTSGTRGSAKAQGEIRLSLVPAAARSRSNTRIAADLRARLEGAIPGMQIRTRAPQGQFLLERILAAEEGVTVEAQSRLENIARPTGYDLVVAGDFEEQQKAFRELAVSLLLALLLVYMVLASQYESLTDPCW